MRISSLPRSSAPLFAAARANLIIDVGMSEGNDTAFYLAKGFDVVGVEADPTMHEALRRRFATEIAARRLHLLHRAAAGTSGETVRFWHDNHDQGHSRLHVDGNLAGNPTGDGRMSEFAVTTVDWNELRAVAGVPHYMKIDIEGAEPAFLRSLAGTPTLPSFISAEVQTFQPIQALHDVGYRHFRLINQTMFHGIRLPEPPLEGTYAPPPDPQHWSGPFGRELMGRRWFGFEEIRAIHDSIHRLWEYGTLITGWMDCHACVPDMAD